MKKVVLIAVLGLLFALLGAVTITTKTGVSYKGDILDVIGDQYHVKTSMGKVVVFKDDIFTATDDGGYDITASVLKMSSKSDTQFPDNKAQLNQYKVIAYPLWVIAISGIAYYSYFSYRLNNPKK